MYVCSLNNFTTLQGIVTPMSDSTGYGLRCSTLGVQLPLNVDHDKSADDVAYLSTHCVTYNAGFGWVPGGYKISASFSQNPLFMRGYLLPGNTPGIMPIN